MPDIGTVNRYGETWDGAQWQDPPSTGAPAAPRHRFGDLMRESGPTFGQPELPPTVPGHVPPDYEGLRNVLTMGGMLAGSALVPEVAGPAAIARFLPTLLRVAGAATGGATGRVAASGIAGVPEGSSVGGEAAQGAVEGGVGEFLPVAAAPVLRGGGRLLRAVGGALDHGINIGGVSAPPWLQTGAIRTLLTHVLGGGSLTGDVVGTVAPKAVEGVGHAMDWTGTRMGGRTTTELVEDGLTSLARRTGLLKDEAAAAAPTRAERVAAGAERYAGERRANAAQQAAREAASGMAPDLGEQVPVTTHRTVPQPDVDELRQATGRMENERRTFDAEVERILARPREEGGPVGQGLRPAGPPAPPERSILDSLRQRSGTSVRPGDAPPPPTSMPPLTVPEPPAVPSTPRAGRTGTGFTMAAPPLDIPEPMASHTVVRSPAVENLEARTVAPAATAETATPAAAPRAAAPPTEGSSPVVEKARARTTGRRAAPPTTRPTTAPWLDVARERIAEGAVVDPELRQLVAEVDAAAAAAPPTTATPPTAPRRARDARGRIIRTPPPE